MSMLRRPAHAHRGYSLIEVLVALFLFGTLFATAWMLHRSGTVGVQSTLGPQMGLQMTTRKALVEFIKELQECVEFVRPYQGSTLNYLMARNKLDQVLLTYMVKNDKDSAREGRDVHDVYVYLNDTSVAAASRQRLLFGGVTRLTFTALGSGVVQIRMDVTESNRIYALLTTVRARNIELEGEL